MIEQLPLFSVPTAEAPAPQKQRDPNALRDDSSLKAAILAWCAHMRKEGARENTVKSFGGDLNLFAAFLGGGRSLNTITTRDLEKWLEQQRALGRSPKTYARRVTSFKAFFRWLEGASVLPNDPAAPIIQQTVISPLPAILTEAEAETARAAAKSIWQRAAQRRERTASRFSSKSEAFARAEKPDIRPYLLFTLLLQTGIKKSECLNLELNHVDVSNPEEPLLWVRYNETRNRYKERKLRLEPSWISVYDAYVAEYKPEQKVFPYSPRRLEYLLEDITVAAGLSKHISFEMCRWTCAVRDAKAGMDFDKIRQRLGLSKIQWREIGMKLKKLVEPGI